MHSFLDNLPELADRLRRGDPEAPELRRETEECFELLIRSAIHSGTGIPQVVNWVRLHLPPVPCGQSPESAAPAMARLLCDTLLRPYLAPPAVSQTSRETVRDW